MANNFKFTQQELDDMMIKALKGGAKGEPEGGGMAKPSLMNRIRAGSKLAKLRK